MIGSSLRRFSLILSALLLVLVATPGRAADPLKPARDCRKETAKKLAKLAAASFKAADACHKKRNACRSDEPKCSAAAGANCNGLPIALSANDAAALQKKCPTPPQQILEGLVYPDDLVQQLATLVAARVHASSAAVQGTTNLADASKTDPEKLRKKQNRKCHDTIGRERTKLAKKILTGAITCQNDADKDADVFGPREDGLCTIRPTVSELASIAHQKILKACTRPAKSGGGAITPAEVGSCTKNFPFCVTDPAVATAETLADEPYTLVSTCSPVLQSSRRGIFRIVRRFFRFGLFNRTVTKIPQIAKRKNVRSRPIGRAGDPPPEVTVNRSAFHPGGGRSMRVTVPTAAVSTSKLLVGIAASGESCDAEVFELDLPALAAAGELSPGAPGTSTLDVELEFREREDVPDLVTIRTALTNTAGEQTSAAATVSLASRGNLELVENLNPTDSSLPRSLTPVGSRLFFVARQVAQDQVWVAEGDPPVLRSFPSPIGGKFLDLTNVDGTTLFFGHCVSDTGTDCTLWKIVGDAPTATLVATIRSSCRETPAQPVGANGKLVFAAEGTDGNGCDPRVSDGTDAGTLRLADIGSGRAGGKPREFTLLGTDVFFVADELKDNSRDQIWRTNGTPGGTLVRTTFAPGVDLDELEALEFDGALYFRADGKTLYRLDATNGTQVLIKPFADGIDHLTAGQNALYFVGCEGSDGCELWRLPPGSQTPARVSSITPDNDDPFIDDLTPVGGEVFFRACSPTAGCELWRSDAASGGSRQVADIARGTASSFPNDLTNILGRVYFEATDGERGPEIWESDGTDAGTVRIRDFRLGDNGVAGGFISSPVGLDRSLFFPRLALSASDPSDPQANTGEELWRLETFEGSAPPPTPTPTPDGGPTPSSTPVVVPTGGPCCTQHSAKGCVEPSCAACVCALEGGCCSVAWDAACAARASVECLANCSCVAPTPPTTPTPSPTITVNPISPCCEASSRRSCSILACAQEVCGDDPVCCGAEGGSWDSICVQAARSIPECGCPTSVPTGTPTPIRTPTPRPSTALPAGPGAEFKAFLTGVGAGTRAPALDLQYGVDAATFDLNRPPRLRCTGAPDITCTVESTSCGPLAGTCVRSVPGPEDSDAFKDILSCALGTNEPGANSRLDDPVPVPTACPKAQFKIDIGIGYPMIAPDGGLSRTNKVIFRTGANAAVALP